MEPDGRWELTTVADDFVQMHLGTTVARFEDLRPATNYAFHGHQFRTLDRPPGELLSRLATVNDIHFGEVECGRIDDSPSGPILRRQPGQEPYPETMNRGAAVEIAAAGIATVLVKGDLTDDGTDEQFDAFERCYRPAFDSRLHVIRGNHDAYRGQQRYAGDQVVKLPGLIVAMLDTTIAGRSTGRVGREQLDWLGGVAADASRLGLPVLVVGHHQQWVGGDRSPDYFGINPDDSERLTAVIAAHRSIVAYAAGHTHRHRVRRIAGGVPSIEVGCVKDFPGTWAEYRVYESAILQIVHRISTQEALAWSEQCRHLYADFGIDYRSYALGTLEERCLTITRR
jgi:3',5'-cyclic-AMP phosphodiesterase